MTVWWPVLSAMGDVKTQLECPSPGLALTRPLAKSLPKYHMLLYVLHPLSAHETIIVSVSSRSTWLDYFNFLNILFCFILTCFIILFCLNI